MLSLASPRFLRHSIPDISKESVVSRKLALRLAGSLLLLAVPALSQEFSADLVRQKPQNTAGTKVSVSGDKVRFAVNAQKNSSFAVINVAQRTSTMVLPDAKSYVVSPPGHLSSSIPLFHIDDPENACKAWEKSMENPGTCKRVGDDTVNGRETVKYTGAMENGDAGTAWIDKKLNFVIKWEGQKTVAELQNIQEGPQEASLFEVSGDYQKLDTVAAHKTKKKPARPPLPHK
jgi:hypothetical protein